MRVWTPNQNKRDFQRDYSKKTYGGNPLFLSRKNAHKQWGRSGDLFRKFKKYLGILLVVGFFFGAIGLIIYGPFFKLNNIIISGVSNETSDKLRTIFEKQLAEKRVLPPSNIIFFNNAKFNKEIETYFILDSVNIRKQLWHTILISASERPMVAGFLNNDNFFAIDKSGIIIRPMKKQEIKSIIKLPDNFKNLQTEKLSGELSIDNENNKLAPKNPFPVLILGSNIFTEPLKSPNAKPMVLGTSVLPVSALQLIMDVDTQLEKTIGTKITWYGVRDKSETIEIFTNQGYKLFFTAALIFEEQNQRLVTVLKEKLGSKKGQLEYIDLRYSERIFYKLKDAESSQIKPIQAKIEPKQEANSPKIVAPAVEELKPAIVPGT